MEKTVSLSLTDYEALKSEAVSAKEKVSRLKKALKEAKEETIKEIEEVLEAKESLVLEVIKDNTVRLKKFGESGPEFDVQKEYVLVDPDCVTKHLIDKCVELSQKIQKERESSRYLQIVTALGVDLMERDWKKPNFDENPSRKRRAKRWLSKK